MPNLKEVKTRIQSVVSTQQITKSMKMVAAAKSKKAQDKVINIRPYVDRLTNLIQRVESNLDNKEDNVYTKIRAVEKVLLVAITSDRGLCGGFNSSVIKETIRLIKDDFPNKKITLLCIGKKGYDILKKQNVETIADFVSIFQDLNFNKARETANFIIEKFLNKEYDKIKLIYNESKNIATQILKTKKFLPLELKLTSKNPTQNLDYIFEPNQDAIITEIIPKTLRANLYKALLESNSAEHSARMTAMDKATENAGDLLKELRLTYNRTRQAAITKEILEIIGGAEALNQ